MSMLTIRNHDPSIKDELGVRGAKNGRFTEAETRAILTDAVTALGPGPELNLYDRIRARIEPLGGANTEPPSRPAMREPPAFEWSFP